jgi:uncharacterized protein YdaU (DUF1376 family)
MFLYYYTLMHYWKDLKECPKWQETFFLLQKKGIARKQVWQQFISIDLDEATASTSTGNRAVGQEGTKASSTMQSVRLHTCIAREFGGS